MKKIAVVLLAALSLSGCTMYSLEKLRHTTPSGTPFQNALSKRYMNFAAQEEKEYDWFNSWHFADKGLRAAYGKDVEPEKLEEWQIPQSALPELQKARDTLMRALPPAMKTDPEKAAEAQFYFDCWVAYQEAGWQEEEIAHCRDGLAEALQELRFAPSDAAAMIAPKKHAVKAVEKPAAEIPSVVEKKPAEAVPAPEAKPETPPAAEVKPEAKASPGAKTVSYAVFFEWGKPDLTDAGKTTIADIIKSLQGLKDYQVVIRQRSTSASLPSDLAKSRATAVKQQLIVGGIPENAIITAADGMSIKAAARRVEIFINE